MDNVSGVQAYTTSDVVVDLLSGVQIESTTNRDRSVVPPKPAPRRRKKRPKEGRQVAENHGSTSGGSCVKQTLPPEDDMLLVNAPVADLAESIVNNESETRYIPESSVLFTVGEGSDYQLCEYNRDTLAKPYVMSLAPEEFNSTHLLSISSSVSGGEELLLASVPYQTLRIEPSPALTLNSPKHQSSRANANGCHSGWLKSSGSLSDDLDNLQEMASFGRSSSTPMLIGDGK